MSLKFKQSNDTKPLSLPIVYYNSKSSKFVLKPAKSSDTEFYFDFCFDKNPSYSHLRDSQFEVFLFHNSDFAANDIYQIVDINSRDKVNRGRLGFLIPIQSLLTSEHDFGDNEHFSPYAYHASRILLTGKSLIPHKVTDIPTSSNIDLEIIYGENTHVLILHKPYIKIWEQTHNVKFNIAFFKPCLWSYGYLHIINSNFDSLYEDQENGVGADKPDQAKIEMIPIVDDLRNDPFIINFFTSFLYDQKHELIRFHLLYQVIESLIEKVFQTELGGIIEEFDKDINNFYDIKEQLSKVTNEKSRIDKLFNNYCVGHNTALKKLNTSCNELLNEVNPDFKKKSSTRALYKVRSLVFHNFRSLPSNYKRKLAKINDDFEKLIILAVTSFKCP